MLHHSGQHARQLVHSGILVPVEGEDIDVSDDKIVAWVTRRSNQQSKSKRSGYFLFIFFLNKVDEVRYVYLYKSALKYPCGNCDAPICCPGASTWQTTKCLVISCMSSLLKKELKHNLSAGVKEKADCGLMSRGMWSLFEMYHTFQFWFCDLVGGEVYPNIFLTVICFMYLH